MKRGRKSILLISGIFSIFLVNLITAAPCVEDDRIMRLFNSGNSHGAEYNNAVYTQDLCYSDIFGDTFTNYLGVIPPAGIHSCNGSNKVLGLFLSSNSHAEEPYPAVVNYPIGVCYGDLVCQLVSDPAICPVDYQLVARLFQLSNSHLDITDNPLYPHKICCLSPASLGPSPPPPPSTGAYWTDVDGNPIAMAQIGDTVLMVLTGETSSYDYDVFEDDGASDYSVTTVSDTYTEGGDLFAKFEITQEVYDAADDGAEGSEEEFYFIVNGNTSDILVVAQGSFDNTPPTTKIVSPENECNYTINSGTGLTNAIEFNQLSTDPDDDLQALWTFGDSTDSGWLVNCLTTGDCNTTHQYDKFGVKTISLRVEELTRDQYATDSTRVMVYREGMNVLAIIDEPPYNKTVEGRVVYINANRSKAVNCSFSSVDCEASAPGDCEEIVDCSDPGVSIYCYKMPGLGVNYDLIFDWTFDGVEKKTGNWSTGYSDYVEFFHAFADVGTHDIKLRVGYGPL